jgi:NADPH2:quinone reductase
MKAVLCNDWGTPDTVTVAEIDSPELGPGEARVAVYAAGVNFGDILSVAGQYQEKPELPFIPGMEFAGEVMEVDKGVSNVRVGDRVMGIAPKFGAFAEEVVSSAMLLAKIPDKMDYVKAAAFPITYGTSHLALTRRAKLQPDETLLVLGAAGGVGLTAVEIGNRMGAKVIAAASTADKLKLAEKYGAAYAINYAEEDLRERVKKITGGRGADVIYDPVGGEAFEEATRCINWEGRLLVIGFASGTIPQFSINYALVKNFSIIGMYCGRYGQQDPETLMESLETLLEWYDGGMLKPYVSATFSLEKAGDAMNALANRASTGKVVINVRGK